MRDDEFFKDTPRKPLDMEGETIEFPILYYDLRTITAIFTARSSKLKKLLPHPNCKPVEMLPGVGMLGVTCFEYYDTSIGPYNEIAITIPMKFPPGFQLPGWEALKMMLTKDFFVYIRHLPVTTEIALRAGIYFWNYPKFLSEIIFEDRGDKLEVSLKEKGELILKLSARKLPLTTSSKFVFHTYSYKDGVIMHAPVEGWAPKFGSVTLGRGFAELELGEHPISQELRELKLSSVARTGFYGEGTMTKLYDPDQRWKADTLELISG